MLDVSLLITDAGSMQWVLTVGKIALLFRLEVSLTFLNHWPVLGYYGWKRTNHVSYSVALKDT